MRRSVGLSGSVLTGLRHLYYATWIGIGLFTIGMGGALLLWGRSPQADWLRFLLLVLLLLGLAGWLVLRSLYFRLMLKVVEQRVLQRRFPQAHREIEDMEIADSSSGASGWAADWETIAAQAGSTFPAQSPKQRVKQLLLQTPSYWLMKQALVRSLKVHLREAPIALESALAALRLLAYFDPVLASKILPSRLSKLPPVLQLESLAIMTAVGRNAWNIDGHQPKLSRQCRQRLNRQRHQIQRDLPAVQALMTPLTGPDVFAAALRHSLYLSPSPSMDVIEMYMQQSCSATTRAVAAAFVLNSQPHAAHDAAHGGAAEDPANDHALGHFRARVSSPVALRTQAEQQLRAMLTHDLQVERQAASEALKELPDLSRFKAEIAALLEDFSPQVRKAALAAIGQTRSKALYPYLLKALRSPLTEALAQDVLLCLQDEAVPLLQRCARHPNLSLPTKERSWRILAAMGTDLSRIALAEEVFCQQGQARSSLLKLLWESATARPTHAHLHRICRHQTYQLWEERLLNHQSPAIEAIARPAWQDDNRAALLEALAGVDGVMQLVREELWLLSHCYAALVELHPRRLPGVAATDLRQVLQEQQRAISERILMFLQIRYPSRRFNPIVQQLRDRKTRSRGLKRLGQMLEPPLKAPLLAVFSPLSAANKRAAFKGWEGNRDCASPAERLRWLIALDPGLEPGGLACAYALALEQGIALPDKDILRGLDHAVPEVQAAAATYLNEMPDAVVNELLQVPTSSNVQSNMQTIA